jgi:hypothetical protein
MIVCPDDAWARLDPQDVTERVAPHAEREVTNSRIVPEWNPWALFLRARAGARMLTAKSAT